MKSTCSACPVADVICRTIELGLTIEGALVSEDDITVIQARPVEAVPFCPTCGAEGVLRDHVTRELTDLPVASHPLHVRLPRYRCPGEQCSRVIFQHQLECAEVEQTTNRCTRSCSSGIDKMSVKAVAAALGLGWDLISVLRSPAFARWCRQPAPGRVSPRRRRALGPMSADGQGDLHNDLVDLTPLSRHRPHACWTAARAGRKGAGHLAEGTPRCSRQHQVVTMDGFTGYPPPPLLNCQTRSP